MATVELWKTSDEYRTYYTLKYYDTSVDIYTNLENKVKVRISNNRLGGIQENSIYIESLTPIHHNMWETRWEFDYGLVHFHFAFPLRDSNATGFVDVGDWRAYLLNGVSEVGITRNFVPHSQLTLHDNNYRVLEELLYWLLAENDND